MQNAEQGAKAPLDAKEAASVLKMNSRTLVHWARCGYVPAHPLVEANFSTLDGVGRRRVVPVNSWY
jgi:hypothetical protein